MALICNRLASRARDNLGTLSQTVGSNITEAAYLLCKLCSLLDFYALSALLFNSRPFDRLVWGVVPAEGVRNQASAAAKSSHVIAKSDKAREFHKFTDP
eukprot:3896567-Amphidinium_carterae.2